MLGPVSVLKHVRVNGCVSMQRLTQFFPHLALSPFTEMESETEGVAHLKLVISAYPAPLVVVMRYLFAFLNQYVP
jgi:hypothetical protein